MVEVKILKQETIGPAQVREKLEVTEKKAKSLEGIQQKVKDNIVKFSKLNKEKETKLVREIKGLNIPRVSDSHIAQIVTIMPKDVDELKIVFAGSKTTITAEDLDKIQGIIKQYGK